MKDKKTAVKAVAIIVLVMVIVVSCCFLAGSNTSDTMVRFKDGKAQDVFKYTSGAKKSYSNINSNIIRFCVYVETDNDTDGDGKCDLVKAFVQVPRAAVEKKYKAPVIYEADPTSAGVTDREYSGDKRIDKNLSEKILENSSSREVLEENSKNASKRKAEGELNTMDLAVGQDVKEWRYKNPLTGKTAYSNRELYDYFLVRGFAVVQCAGLGTIGSEGYSTCGTEYEAEAFSSVIEWLAGERAAFSDDESNIKVKADWSNGKVGMTGQGFAGATQMEVATTGVSALKTVVPVSGIASWYDYSNSQGITTRTDPSYSSRRALYCASRCAEETDHSKYSSGYYDYLNMLTEEELDADGDYAAPWRDRDYTGKTSDIKIPALIFQGLNDEDVNTKQMQHMYNAFMQDMQSTKLVLSQTASEAFIDDKNKYELKIGDELYDELLNKWFSHYLCDENNRVAEMPQVIWQNNENGEFTTFDTWESFTDKTLVLSDAKKETTEKSEKLSKKAEKANKKEKDKASKKGKSSSDEVIQQSTDLTYVNTKGLPKSISEWDASVYNAESSDSLACYEYEMDDDLIIKGGVTVNLLVKLRNVSQKNGGQMLTAYLIDSSDKAYKAYEMDEESRKIPHETVSYAEDGEGVYTGSGLRRYDIDELEMSKVTDKVIARGWIDLFNPDADNNPENSVKTEKKIKKGDVFNYSIKLTPNLYKVKKGHSLKLVIFGYDLGKYKTDKKALKEGGTEVAEEFVNKISRDYSFIIDNELSSIVIPKNSSKPAWENEYTKAWHLPEEIENSRLDYKGKLKN